MGALKYWERNIEAGSSADIPNVNGFVFLKNIYSYGGCVLYYATFGSVNLILNPAGYQISIELTHKTDRTLTIKNISSGVRRIEVYYQSLQI